MFDPLLADGITSGAGEKLATFAVKCLAVGGGFLVGYFLGAVVAWALDRWVFANKSPAQLKKIVSVVAGIALAILVALIVFGEGGSGLFGGGGGNQGDGKGSANENKGKPEPAPAPEPKPDEKKDKKEEVKPPSPPMPGDVRVTILPDDEVKDGRFYLIAGDPNPKSLPEFKDAILAKRKEAKPELKQVVFGFKKDALDKTHPIVQNATVWLGNNNIGVNFE